MRSLPEGQGGKVGIAVEEPVLASAAARSLAAGGHQAMVFDRSDVLRGAWPDLGWRAIVTSSEALRLRHMTGQADPPCPLILAVRRSSLGELRFELAKVSSFVVTDEALIRLPSLLPLAAFGLSIMPRTEANRLILDSHLARLRALSPRDREVLWALGSGGHNQTIARQLGMTPSSAKVHIRRIVRQLGFRNRTDTAIFAATLASAA